MQLGIWSATTPVFLMRDPLKCPDLNHAVKRDPRANLRSAKNNWDFWTSLPEALHQVSDSIKT
jgi:catalase